MKFQSALTLLSAAQSSGFIKHRTVLEEDCTKHNHLQMSKIWRLSHSTG